MKLLKPTTQSCLSQALYFSSGNMYSRALFFLCVITFYATFVPCTSVATTDETSDLSKRVDILEGLLAGYQSFFHRQGSRIEQHDSVLSAQRAEIAGLRKLITEQGDRISKQEALVSQQNAQLSSQRTMLLRQWKLIDQLQTSNAECTLQMKTVKAKLNDFVENIRVGDNPNSRNYLLSGMLETDNIIKTTSRLHDIKARSDDAGPLEAVVFQLNQKVTELSADIQALGTRTNADIQALQQSNVQQDHSILNAHTSTFIHWGSSQCSNESQLVYSGVVGGSFWNDTGAAANYLCLTLSPVPPQDNHHFIGNHLYGTEYESNDIHDDKDAVCAVCRASQPTTVMIPGTNVCTPGWRLQYSGYLMAGNFASPSASEFVCVDSAFESRAGSNRNDNGRQLYYVAARCGSLPCEPYVENTLISCVVCSK